MVKIKVLRPLMFEGRAWPMHEVLKVAPSDAAALMDSGRAALADPRDVDQVNDARKKNLAAVLAKMPQGKTALGPWQPIDRY